MTKNKLWKLREYINVHIFSSKKIALVTFRTLSIFISLAALTAIVYYHGYAQSERILRIYNLIIRISFIFYFVKFVIRYIYNFEPRKFFRENWFEALIMALLFIEGIVLFLFKTDLVKRVFQLWGLRDLEVVTTLIVQLYFFVIVTIELGRAGEFINRINLSPKLLLASSFIVLIAGGTFLLMLPEMTRDGYISFINALFTSASASCVTGLIVVDTATYFTLKGQIIILLLIQLGGLNILSFASFFSSFYRSSSSIKYESLVKDFLSSAEVSDSRSLLRRIFLFSMIVELTGSILLFVSWDPGDAYNLKERAFISVFHSVSAFNNAGFSLFSSNLYQGVVAHAYLFQLVIALLIIGGGIGFLNLNYFGIYYKEKYIKGKKWFHLNTGARMAIWTSLLLIIAGMVVMLALEWNKSLSDYSVGHKIVASFFQSVTTRTAGFNTVAIERLSSPVLLFMLLLMYIGASPGSTGGGIKTTSFSIIIKSALSIIQGGRKGGLQ